MGDNGGLKFNIECVQTGDTFSLKVWYQSQDKNEGGTGQGYRASDVLETLRDIERQFKADCRTNVPV